MNSSFQNNRRQFLKNCGLLTAPVLLPGISMANAALPTTTAGKKNGTRVAVNFIWDGLFFTPDQYINKLAEINEGKTIQQDYYGKGGPTELLEKEFAKATGKEKAIYVPSGTMANQIAMKLLNGSKTKVVVPENSHIFRDEGDAAQSVHELRLIALGKDKPYYDLNELKASIEYSNKGFHYDSGLGTIVIENPVRRVQNQFIPLEKIKEIASYCRQNDYRIHLDGARIHIAAAFSGVSVSEYASYFDTVYISLYKYLNATGGAILCGDEDFIDQVAHHIKILGGSILRNWSVTAMALHYLPGVNERWKQVIDKTNRLVAEMNKIDGLQISPLENGTNTMKMTLSDKINPKKLSTFLLNSYNIIWMPRIMDAGGFNFVVNESMLMMDNNQLLLAWLKGVEDASN